MAPLQLFALLLCVVAIVLAFIRAFVSDVRGMDLGWLGAACFFAFMLLQVFAGA